MEIKPEGIIGRCLGWVERAGNKLPHPTSLFIILSVLILLLSWLLSAAGYGAVHPINGNLVQVNNLISQSGLTQIMEKTVTNFTHFAPVGTVLVAMLGLGIAEKSGLLASLLRLIVLKTPNSMITPTVVFAGVLSSIAADAGYVVLIPLAGHLFATAGKNPIAGMAAAFAGVSGGFSANLMVGPIDALLSGISTEAARLIDHNYEVSILANYFFMIVSTALITGLGTFVTERVIIPRLPTEQTIDNGHHESLNFLERKGIRNASIAILVIAVLICFATIPADGILRNPTTGSLIKSPFISGIVTLISLTAALAGIIFGITQRTFRSDKDIVESMEQTMAMMAGYIVLMFFAAQFVSYFSWSNIGLISAIKGSELLKTLALHPAIVLCVFIMMAAGLNLLVGSASAKWSVMAPIFVPMFLLAGIPADVTQAAYRVGDSTTNIITPLMPYFGVVVAFMQRYDKDIGIGSIMALMLPYSVALLLGWSVLFSAWVILGIPFGPSS